MIDYSQANLAWLADIYKLPAISYQLDTGDATDYQWSNFDTIASETYLGQPFSSLPAPAKLNQVIQDVNTITKKFLQNLAKQAKPGLRLCIAVPAWQTGRGFKHLTVIDQLTDIGYKPLSFVQPGGLNLIINPE